MAEDKDDHAFEECLKAYDKMNCGADDSDTCRSLKDCLMKGSDGEEDGLDVIKTMLILTIKNSNTILIPMIAMAILYLLYNRWSLHLYFK